jgi:hypothetical protein
MSSLVHLKVFLGNTWDVVRCWGFEAPLAVAETKATMHQAQSRPRTVTLKADAENYRLTQSSESFFVRAPLLIVPVVAVIVGGIGIVKLNCRRKTSESMRLSSSSALSSFVAELLRVVKFI